MYWARFALVILFIIGLTNVNYASEILLKKEHFTQPQLMVLTNRIVNSYFNFKYLFPSHRTLPEKIELGMGNVPVLNQEHHGTCVTFAASAVINAIIGKGDYVSELCSLQLGKYLSMYGFVEDGWYGASGKDILFRFQQFGIISKKNQLKYYENYPIITTPTYNISISEYSKLSESLQKYGIRWNILLDPNMHFIDLSGKLVDVKEAISMGDRVLFGANLVNLDRGIAGAIGTHNKRFDSWIVNSSVLEELDATQIYAGHEMVITGYDDNAVVTDYTGNEYKGLLTLRNSWGDALGDKGNFYMTYDYFKLFAMEAYRVGRGL